MKKFEIDTGKIWGAGHTDGYTDTVTAYFSSKYAAEEFIKYKKYGNYGRVTDVTKKYLITVYDDIEEYISDEQERLAEVARSKLTK